MLLLLLALGTLFIAGATMTFDFCDGANGEGKSGATDCWIFGTLRCKNGWLKKTSNGIRSFALRRKSPMRRLCSS